MSKLHTINPSTGDIHQALDFDTNKIVKKKLTKLQAAHIHLKALSLSQRADILHKIAKNLRDNKQSLAKLASLEMGKISREAIAEIEKCASVCDYYADNSTKMLADNSIKTNAKNSYISYQPLGVLLAIMPWNFPYWQLFRVAAPAIMAGNTLALKHSSLTPACALAIQNLIHQTYSECSLLETLLIPSKDVSKIIENSIIKAVTLTGSEKAGIAVAQKAGSCLKKTVLELGGSDAYLVFEDADLTLALDKIIQARMLNCGQSCISAKRIIVHKNIEQPFTSQLLARLKQLRMGDALDPQSDYGPMASIELRNELHEQVQRSIMAGAKCILGGTITERQGSYYPITLLTNLNEDNPALIEELFGPVFCVTQFETTEKAVAMANSSRFGLGAAVFSKNEKLAEDLAKNHLQAGSCFVNDFVKSDPRLPFGGIKASGYGRELSHLGLYEFMNAKTIVIGKS